MLEALYPADHPYHHSVIGSMADLSAARLDDVAAFFRTYYVPNNAILCVAGDFQPAQAKEWIEKYFGPSARGPEVKPPEPSVPHLADAKHIQMTDAVSLPRAQLIWPTVPADHPDEPALDVLAAVLGGCPRKTGCSAPSCTTASSRRRSARRIRPSCSSGTFEVELYARPGQKLDELVKIADAEIERLKKEGPTAARGQEGPERAGKRPDHGASVGDPQGRRPQPVRWRCSAIRSATGPSSSKIFAVTPDDVKRVARQYLGAAADRARCRPGRAGVSTCPKRRSTRPSRRRWSIPIVADVKDTFDRSVMPKLGPTPRYVAAADSSGEAFERSGAADRRAPRAADRDLRPGRQVGRNLDAQGKEGLARSPPACSTRERKRGRPADRRRAGRDRRLAGAAGELESTTVSLTTLTRHLDRGLDLYADVILNPSFPEKELDRLKLQRLAQLKARADDAEQTAAAVFPRLIYGPDHPYGRPDLGTPASVQSITRDDAVAFYKRIMVPGNAALVIVGDVQPDAITAALEARLGAWPPGPVPPPPPLLPAPAAAGVGNVYLIDKPAAAQSVLTVGKIGAARKSPDFFSLTVMNAILGGQFASRINLNLREDKGYSYGAESSFSFLRGPGPFEAGGDGSDGGDQGVAGRDLQGADRHHRQATGHRRRAGLCQAADHPGLPPPVRDDLRRRRPDRDPGRRRPARR